MSTVIFVTGFVPSNVGDGGNHRAYQILRNAELTIGKEQVRLISFPQWRRSRTINPLADFARRARRRLADYLDNPYKFLVFTHFSARAYAYSGLAAYYAELVRQADKLMACIIDHSGFADLIPVNSRYNIPTISCIQNLESLDSAALYYESRGKWATYARAIDFNNEFGILGQCTERLFISKVETGLVGGLGLPSRYYPYLPVETIKERLQSIRQERLNGNIEPGLFLLLGSVDHYTTKASLMWFIQNAQTHGLPNDMRVVVIGPNTDRLLPSGRIVPGIELKGWLDQDDLDRLLIRARAVLVPHRLGFGSVTRLPELSCAGVPAITSRHPSYAADVPPGVVILDDRWESWYTKMEEFIKTEPDTREDDYNAWAESQPKTLELVITDLLKQL